MVPLVVDPQALFAVGGAVIAAGDGLAANLTVLTAGFAAHTGLDAAGAVFGLAYQDAGEKVLQAAAAAVNACRQSGALIQQGAANYSQAEAASTLGGGAGALQAPPAPAKLSAPGPPGTWGKGQPPPLLWAVVQSFVDDVWPDGDVAGLHAAAARWRGFAGAAGGMRSALSAAKALLDAHQIPEGEKIDDALSQIGDCMGKLGEASGGVARALDDFANEVDGAQHHIRDLLNRLGSLTDLGHDVMLIIKGDALDEIKKIARDINDVLHDLGREARAAEQGVKAGLGVVDGLVVKLEKYVRGELKQFLGDAIGNQVATVFDVFANANEGALKGAVGMALSIGDLDPRWFLVDPHGAAETWTDMAKGLWKGSLVNGVLNPQEFVDANWQQLKALLHLDDWSTARPGLGFGENAFDVAMFFIPGAGEAGAATEAGGAALEGAEAAEAAGAAGRAGAEAAGGLAGARGALADIAGAGGDLTKNLEGVAGKLPKIEPPPVGGRPVGVSEPKPFDAPVESVPRPLGADVPPGRAVYEPPAAPAAGGPHDPIPAAAHPPAIPAPTAERVPSTVPQLVDHSPVRELLAPSGGPVEPAPTPAHVSQPAPSFTSAAPHSLPAAGHPPELPAPGGGWHGHGDGGHPSSHHGGGPHDGKPHGPGDGPANRDGPADEGEHPDPGDRLTSDDLSALSHYTGFGYSDLNDALRSDALDASQHARVEALKSALNKLPPYEGPVVRGTNLPPEALAQYRPGEFIIEKGFMSTTVNTAVARSPTFAGNVEFRILSSTGRDISSFSTFPAEQEILFPAGTRFYVVSKIMDPVTGRTVIRMAER
ncbi:ADP-ribosyltransferase [Mycobacterium sp. E3198]|uniref:ADP-ribosyltransferase n=1 Tax=Mycobacterium sp. E3198 TaxID=1834143 RepID=UPI00080148B8|nr:ADP-ribosyltransferase [Mycobacterium sp. E3198]OBG30628.1 hypothetical protein A5673_03710 [Mycobacterium sp. E3198]